jgi:hypothetical protein
MWLTEIAQSGSGAASRGVAVVNAGHLQKLLGNGGGDDARAARGGDEAHEDAAALASDLQRFIMTQFRERAGTSFSFKTQSTRSAGRRKKNELGGRPWHIL